MSSTPNRSHAWRKGYNNLAKGRTHKRVMFQPYGNRMVNGFDLVKLGIEVPNRGGHHVTRSTDIGQEWMRQQARLDASFDVWRKLLEPTQFPDPTCASPIVEEELASD